MDRFKILIVEDSQLERMILNRFLNEEYTVAESENGVSALEVLDGGFDPDLIISDIFMPEMDGKELLCRLSANEKYKDIPVIIATGADNIEEELECLELGCSDFIRKPYNPLLLKLRVVNTLDRKAYYKLRQQMIVDTFERHIDPSIVQYLLKNNTKKIPAEQKELTILFADIRSFTTISEKLSPTEVFNLLTDFFTISNQCIKKYSGILDKYIGDSVMAFWGAPEECEDAAYLACCAAYEIVENTKKLFASYSQLTGIEVALGIGINKGQTIVGNVGPEDRVDYTVIGDTVNTASRLENNAPANSIYLSRSVVEAAGGKIIAAKLPDQLKLKGKTQPIDVYSLTGIK